LSNTDGRRITGGNSFHIKGGGAEDLIKICHCLKVKGRIKPNFILSCQKAPGNFWTWEKTTTKTWAEAGIFYLRKTKDNSENLDC
jgi:hypothetical protein